MNKTLGTAKKVRDEFAYLFNYAPVGYLTFGPSGNIRSVNFTGAKMLGCARNDLIGQSFSEFVEDEDRHVFTDLVVKVFASRGKETCRLKLSPLQHFPVCVRIEALVSPSGDECLAVLVDITEKKRAEQALSESEDNLAKAQTMTHVGSWNYDVSSGEIRASAELLRIMCLQPAQSTQEMFASVVHPEDKEMVLTHLQQGVRQGKSYEIEHRLLFEDGSLRWVYSIVEPSLGNDGVVQKLYGTTQDITQRKQAEVELRNKTNELQAIFDSIGDGILVYDQEGLLQHHNLISPQLFPDKIGGGSPCQTIFHPQTSSDPDLCPVERALRGEKVDTSLVLANGGHHSRYIDVTATPIRDELNENKRVLVFFRDVSEKRLQEMRLIQTEKMSSVGVLATGIAHEINNPLTSIAGCAEALLRRLVDAPTILDEDMKVFPPYLETIVREAYRCKDIINHLLSFGRKTDGIPSRVDINSVLVEIVELLGHQARYQQIPVFSNLHLGLPRVMGDSSALRQVFMNLLVNALQSIEESGQIEVTTAKADEEMVSITIRDTGCGMPQAIVDRIWEPFFTTKEVGQGIGLGLALTYNIVKEHGGKIEVESSEGEGSHFKVLLPTYNGS